jgi:hypothetical protein
MSCVNMYFPSLTLNITLNLTLTIAVADLNGRLAFIHSQRLGVRQLERRVFGQG